VNNSVTVVFAERKIHSILQWHQSFISQ